MSTKYWRKQFFVLNVDPFKVDVGVAVNLSEAEIYRRVATRCIDPTWLPSFRKNLDGWDVDGKPPFASDGRLVTLGGGFVVLFHFSKGRFYRTVGLITHEMVHVTQYLLRDRRIPLSLDTEEVHAYMTENLVERTLRRVCT